MLSREVAELARDHVLEAIKHISSSLQLIQGQFPEAIMKSMHRTAGLAIGTLDTDYLAHIFELYPDLDDIPEAPTPSIDT
jgi:hypothetical protein